MVVLQGIITGDFIVRELSNLQKMVKFTISVQNEFKSKGSDKKGYTKFDCNAFGAIADTLCSCCQNGSRLVVVGKLKKTSYLNKKTGEKVENVIVDVDSVYFTGYPSRKRKWKDYEPANEYEFREIDCGDSETPVDDLAFGNGGIKKFMKSIQDDPNMIAGFSNGDNWKPVD